MYAIVNNFKYIFVCLLYECHKWLCFYFGVQRNVHWMASLLCLKNQAERTIFFDKRIKDDRTMIMA